MATFLILLGIFEYICIEAVTLPDVLTKIRVGLELGLALGLMLGLVSELIFRASFSVF